MNGVLTPPTALGFDEFAPGTVLTGNEYEPIGVTFQHLAGQPIRVAGFAPVTGWVIPSPPNAFSSSYASGPAPGYAAACCGVYFNNSHADHFRFNFSPPVRSAGVQLGENDFRGTTMRWLDASGGVIATRFYPAGSPSMGVVGLTGSPTPIAAMEIFNGANDGDGMFFDDVLFEPYAVARPAPIAFIGNFNSNTVSVMNVATGAFIATLGVCETPGPVALAPDGNHLYVFCYSGSLSAIDTRTLNVVTRPFGLSYINGIAVTPDSKQIYVDGGLNDQVWTIDAATLRLTAAFDVPNQPPSGLDNHNGLAFNAAGTRLYVTQCGYGCGLSALSVVDTATKAVIAQIDLGATGPAGVVADPTGSFLYVTHYGAFGSGSTVSVIDTASNSVAASIPVGSGPYGVALNRTGDRLYVANYNDHTLSVVDTLTRGVVATVPVGVAPVGVDVTAEGRRILVTNFSDQSISVVDAASNQVIATIPAQGAAYSFGTFITGESLPPSAATTIVAAPAVASFLGPVLLSANLTSSAGAESGQRLTFRLGPAVVGSAVTDGSGNASIVAAAAGFTPGAHAGAIIVEFAGGMTLESSTASATLTVDSAVATALGPDPERVTYSGYAQPALVRVIGVFGEVLPAPDLRYRRAGTEEWSVNAPREAADYEVEISFAGTAQYQPLQVVRQYGIDRAMPAILVSDAGFTYDGEPHPALASVIGVLGEDLGLLTFLYSTPLGDPPVDAGEYTVQAQYGGSENYLLTSATAHIAIARALPTLTIASHVLTYDGQPHALAVSVIGARGESLAGATVEYNPGGLELPVRAGIYEVAALYPGDVNYEPVDGWSSLEIQRAAPSIAVTGGTFSYDGQPHGSTASAIGVLGEDLGAVAIEYSPGGAAPTEAGTYTVTASFAGNGDYQPATRDATIVIEPGAATVQVNGGTLQFDAEPHPASGTVTGVNGESLGELTFTYNGSSQSPIAAGTYEVIASFAGNRNYAPAHGTAMIHITQRPLIVAAVPSTKVYGQPNPQFNITVTGLVGADTAEVLRGTLTFTTEATAASVVGAYRVLPGNVVAANYQISFIDALLTVTQAGSTTTITSSSNPAGYLQAIALRANLQIVPAGAGTATGTVEFFDGATTLGSASVVGGAATINIVLASGTHDITARYLGSTDVAASDGAFQQVVNTRADSTTTTLRIRQSQSLAGEAVTFEIGVNGGSGSITGFVELLDGSDLLATLPLAGANASYTTSALTPGSHTFTARYTGDSSNTPSTSLPVVHTVTIDVPLERSNVNLSAKQAREGETIPVDVVVSGSGVPSGEVTLYVDGAVSGILPLQESRGRAVATFMVSPLPVGTHLATVVYSGSTIHAGSSAQIQLRVR